MTTIETQQKFENENNSKVNMVTLTPKDILKLYLEGVWDEVMITTKPYPTNEEMVANDLVMCFEGMIENINWVIDLIWIKIMEELNLKISENRTYIIRDIKEDDAELKGIITNKINSLSTNYDEDLNDEYFLEFAKKALILKMNGKKISDFQKDKYFKLVTENKRFTESFTVRIKNVQVNIGNFPLETILNKKF